MLSALLYTLSRKLVSRTILRTSLHYSCRQILFGTSPLSSGFKDNSPIRQLITWLVGCFHKPLCTMFRRSSSERSRVQKPLRYRSRPQPPSIGVQTSSSNPSVSQKSQKSPEEVRRNLPRICLEGFGRDDDSDEETDERTRLMSGGQTSLLREPSEENDDDRNIHITVPVPEFPIATYVLRCGV